MKNFFNFMNSLSEDARLIIRAVFSFIRTCIGFFIIKSAFMTAEAISWLPTQLGLDNSILFKTIITFGLAYLTGVLLAIAVYFIIPFLMFRLVMLLIYGSTAYYRLEKFTSLLKEFFLW